MSDKLKQRRERLAKAAAGESAKQRPAQGKKARSRRGVSRQARTQFTTQFATLQDAGLPVLRSLKVLLGQMPEGPLKEVVGEIAEEVEAGSPLSDALEKHPKVFDDLYVNMVRAGEASGSLTIIFQRIAEFMEKAEALVRRVRGAMVYPLIVGFVAIAILTFIILYVVPKFEQAFEDMAAGAELPAMTQLLVNSSRFVGEYFWVIGIVIVGAVFGIRAFAATATGRRFFDGLRLRVPLLGPVFREAQVARFSRTLGTLSSSGVPLMQSLEIVGDASGNIHMKEAVTAVRDAVKEGESMARPMAETGMFDDIVINMVDVGEETGELDRMLMRIADNAENEVDARVSTIVSVLEPAMIVIMAGIVGFIVIALYMPLITIQEKLAG